MLTRILKKALKPVAEALFVKHIKAIAAGDYGEALRKAYWWTVGKKTLIGIVLACASVVVLAVADASAETAIGVLSGGAYVLIHAGVLDKGWRTYRPDWLTDSGVYRWLAQNPAEVASGFAAAFMWVSKDCAGAILAWGWTGHPWCDWGRIALVALADVAVFLGVLDATYRSPGPASPPPEHR